MTVHWINKETSKRESAALACKRIRGRHTYDVLAEEIYGVLLQNCIQNKIKGCTTDGGTNFAKAFREYLQANLEDLENATDHEEYELEAHSITNIFKARDNPSYENDVIVLPSHYKCASHALNRVAVADCGAALKDTAYKKIFLNTFAKCNRLWYKQNKSTQCADQIKEILGVYLKTPNDTRWNALFDALMHILKLIMKNEDGATEGNFIDFSFDFLDNNKLENLNKCFDACGLQRLTQQNVQFIIEYCRVMCPLAMSLDILQGENNMYTAYLLPVISTLLEKLDVLKETTLTFCKPLVESIIDGVKKRFQLYFEDTDFVVATCVHPLFKLDWIKDESFKEKAKKSLEDILKSQFSPKVSSVKCEKSSKSFFNFSKRTYDVSFCEELSGFLTSTSDSLSILHNFPEIKKIFIEYNTILPSSASVERLFSAAGWLLNYKKFKLTDESFQQQLLLKINKEYVKYR